MGIVNDCETCWEMWNLVAMVEIVIHGEAMWMMLKDVGNVEECWKC